MRERGLKLIETGDDTKTDTVAPHAGAWIETQHHVLPVDCRQSLPMRERGLKLCLGVGVNDEVSRSPCGSVD